MWYSIVNLSHVCVIWYVILRKWVRVSLIDHYLGHIEKVEKIDIIAIYKRKHAKAKAMNM